MKRIFLIVLDSVGIGAMHDAYKFGDANANTLYSVSCSPKFKLNTLIKLGLSNIDGVSYLPTEEHPSASYGRLSEISAGKDTTIGHWEISGLISETPLPTYPNGFPKEIINEFSKQTGRSVICNLPYSGTAVLDDYADEHIKTGALIVYTSADSVFQIAAHEEIVPVETLYKYCEIARGILVGKHSVGRVIARPFIGEKGNYKRTNNRHDFSLLPHDYTLLDNIIDSGKTVIGVGKISDIFSNRGISESFKTSSNNNGMDVTYSLLERDFNGLCFTNLVDFDMLYGHRNNVDGYASALTEFDIWLNRFIDRLNDDDCLIITADHGCDPGDISTDHTREHTPLIIYGKKINPIGLGTLSGFSVIAATIADMLEIDYKCHGKSIYPLIKKNTDINS